MATAGIYGGRLPSSDGGDEIDAHMLQQEEGGEAFRVQLRNNINSKHLLVTTRRCHRFPPVLLPRHCGGDTRTFNFCAHELCCNRFVAVDHALAAMATAGIVGVFAGAVAARFLAARNKIRTKYGGEIDDDTANAGGRLDSPKMN